MKRTISLLCTLLTFTIGFSQATSIQFILTGPPPGKVGIRGNTPPLSWETTRRLTPGDDENQWTTSIDFPEQTELIEYKYVVENSKGELTWELDGQDNRRLTPGQETDTAIRETWNTPRPVAVDQLPKLSPEALAEDLAILEQAYRTLHPGLYRYNDEAALERHLTDLRQACSRELTYAEAYLEISKFLGKIRCGHTYANFFNQPGLIQQVILGGADKLPFAFRFVGRRMIITKNASADPRFEPGVEIHAINGVPVDRILDSLLTVVKADGSNDAKRIYDLQVIGYDYYEAFDVYFPLFFPPVDGQYKIEGRNLRENTPVAGTVAAITRRERTQRIQDRYGDLPTSPDDLWSFEVINEQTAMLRLGTFTVWDFEMNWKTFLKEAFKTLDRQKIPNLIVDIRGNEGGADEVIDVLGRYLLKSPCSVETYQERVRYEKVPANLKPYLSTWDQSFYDLTGKVQRLDDQFFLRKGEDAAVQQFNASNKAYDGQVYLLIGPGNSSATFYLARLAKACGAATLVGQETGGSRQGLNGGFLFFLRLPNSKIEADIPLLGSFPRSEQPAGGIIPDIVVEPSVEAVIEGRDQELEATLEAIDNE